MRKVKAKPKVNGVPKAKKRPKTADEIMIEQGKQESSRYENIVGKGANLWRSDQEFEEFLTFIDALRHPERHPARAVRK